MCRSVLESRQEINGVRKVNEWEVTGIKSRVKSVVCRVRASKNSKIGVHLAGGRVWVGGRLAVIGATRWMSGARSCSVCLNKKGARLNTGGVEWRGAPCGAGKGKLIKNEAEKGHLMSVFPFLVTEVMPDCCIIYTAAAANIGR